VGVAHAVGVAGEVGQLFGDLLVLGAEDLVFADGGGDRVDVPGVELSKAGLQPGGRVGGDELEQPGEGVQVFAGVEQVDLSRIRDRSTYAEHVTMPTMTSGCWRTACSGGLLAVVARTAMGIVTGFRGRRGRGRVACSGRA
jgi:hypothetical protein